MSRPVIKIELTVNGDTVKVSTGDQDCNYYISPNNCVIDVEKIDILRKAIQEIEIKLMK